MKKKTKCPDLNHQELRSFLESILCTTDIDLDVYTQAFKHKTADADRNYERLEIVGDSLLGFILVKTFFETRPDMTENLITRYKDFLAQNAVLACWSTLWRLDRFIQMGRSRTGCDVTIKILADVFEAFLAAIYMDKGIEAVCRFMADTLHLYEQAACSRPYDIFQASLSKTKNKKKRGGRKTTWEKVLATADKSVSPPAAAESDGPLEHKAADVITEPVVLLRKIPDPWGDIEVSYPEISPAKMDGQLIHNPAEIASHPIHLIPDSWEDVEAPVKQEIQLDAEARETVSDPNQSCVIEAKNEAKRFTVESQHSAFVPAYVEQEPDGGDDTVSTTSHQDEEFQMVQKPESAVVAETIIEVTGEKAQGIAYEQLHDVPEKFEMVRESLPFTEMVSETKDTERADVTFEDWALFVI